MARPGHWWHPKTRSFTTMSRYGPAIDTIVARLHISPLPMPGRNDSVTISVLVIKPEWLQKIVDGIKIWEIRKGPCYKNGQTIYLAASRSATIYARATFVTSHGPLNQEQWINSGHLHGVSDPALPYGPETYAWEIKDVEVAQQPIPFERIPQAVKFQNVRLTHAQVSQAQFASLPPSRWEHVPLCRWYGGGDEIAISR